MEQAGTSLVTAGVGVGERAGEQAVEADLTEAIVVPIKFALSTVV